MKVCQAKNELVLLKQHMEEGDEIFFKSVLFLTVLRLYKWFRSVYGNRKTDTLAET